MGIALRKLERINYCRKWLVSIKYQNLHFKACVSYFLQILIFSSNDSPSKIMKNAFYFI